jgi:hypothetical protein
MRFQLQQTKQTAEFIPFAGGLDVTSPPVTIPPGYARSAKNYEEDVNEGYVSLTGYEAFDGRAAPSAGVWTSLPHLGAGTVAIGSTITGATSGATAVIIDILPDRFIVTKTTGVFGIEASVTGGASLIGPTEASAATRKQAALWTASAANVYRALIQAVPGSGKVLGVYAYNNKVYAFRNAVSGVGMFVSSSIGWQAVSLGFEVYYTAGSGTPPEEGATIVKGGTSAVLKRITVEAGTFAAGTAAGRLIFAIISGGPFTAGAFTSGITANCTSQATISFPVQNGRFEFITTNFTGALTTSRMYGCDGKNRAFEFDGTTLVPLNTSVVTDTPLHLVEHANFLMLSIGGDVIFSAIGDPYNYQAISGAVQVACSDVVTGFAIQPGGSTFPTLAVYCRNRTYMLYGNDPTSWQFVPYSGDTGAFHYSVQKIGRTFALDDRGIIELAQSQAYGNFEESTISKRIQSLITSKRNALTDSHLARDKQQVRWFFSDGSGVYATIKDKSVSFLPVEFPNAVRCSCSVEESQGGAELIYFGSDDGFVYQMEKGTSFNGAPISANLDLVFNNSKSYQGLKKYRWMTFEMSGKGYNEFNASYELSYGSVDYEQSDNRVIPVEVSVVNWDSGITWDSFVFWDGRPLTELKLDCPGDGHNISIKLRSDNDYGMPIKFSGVFLQYSPLRILR